jgi:hypothetical protein
LSSIQGHSSAKDDAGAEAVVARPEAADVGPVPADEIFPPKPERASDAMIADHHEAATYVDARVSTAGCAKMRKTDAQGDEAPARTEASAVATIADQAPQSGAEAMECPGPAATGAGPLPVQDKRESVFHAEPENGLRQSNQNQEETITSVAAGVAGPGCAKMRNIGAHTAPGAAPGRAERRGPDRQCSRCDGARSGGGGSEGHEVAPSVAAPSQSWPAWASLVPVSACRRADSLLTEEEEKARNGLHQAVDSDLETGRIVFPL